ncbi:MAG: Lrp/AsnC family transcriptional regulator [Infirmifilum sp.]|uniref:Lrp/AsnC family transcriptional regulator n=1 Tax=Infirmifilum sp. TaxID=2856575 RepID=UPI003D115A51
MDSGTLTEKQFELLNYFFKKSQPIRVYTVTETQSSIAKNLGITRQALNMHLKKLREHGLIRTGRGFIDLTEKAVQMISGQSGTALIMLKLEPQKRLHIYSILREMPLEKVYRVTGEYDVVIHVSQSLLDQVLNKINTLEGVRETKTYIVIETLK